MGNADAFLILCYQTPLYSLSVEGLTKALSALGFTVLAGIIDTRQPQLGERLHDVHGIITYSSCVTPPFRNWKD